jgi:hypothetical protein
MTGEKLLNVLIKKPYKFHIIIYPSILPEKIKSLFKENSKQLMIL